MAGAFRSHIVQAVVAVVLVVALSLGWSIKQTINVMPNSPISVQIAEWGRTHGLGFFVTQYELFLDRLHPLKVGGMPDLSILRALAKEGTTVGARAPMPTPLTPALPGEGTFRVLRSVHGTPAMQETFVRPDATSSAYLTSVIIMSGHNTRLTLHPGMMDPGTPTAFHSLAHLSNKASTGLLSSFNSGFLVQDSQGGFYLNGHTAGQLRNGAASVVTYKDGHTTVGMWGRDMHMTPNIVSVRQNLRLIVDNGAPVPNMDAAVASRFGAAAGATIRTWRSGLGVTANGDLVYAMGNGLTAYALADVMAKAGAVRAMPLDINFHSTVYIWYTKGHNGLVVPHKVLKPARGPFTFIGNDARDFFALYAK